MSRAAAAAASLQRGWRKYRLRHRWRHRRLGSEVEQVENTTIGIDQDSSHTKQELCSFCRAGDIACLMFFLLVTGSSAVFVSSRSTPLLTSASTAAVATLPLPPLPSRVPSAPVPPPPYVVPPATAPPQLCLTGWHASDLHIFDEGRFGTSDPQLRVFSSQSRGRNRTSIVGQTVARFDSSAPTWDETFCFDAQTLVGTASDGYHLCFDILDDWPVEAPLLLDSGCATCLPGRTHDIRLSGGGRLGFHFLRATPPAPPAAPAPPALPPQPLPNRPPHGFAADVASHLNTRFHRGGPSNDLELAGVLIHTFDGLGGLDPRATPWRHDCTHARDLHFCQLRSDRISASLINGDMRVAIGAETIPLYSFNLA